MSLPKKRDRAGAMSVAMVGTARPPSAVHSYGGRAAPSAPRRAAQNGVGLYVMKAKTLREWKVSPFTLRAPVQKVAFPGPPKFVKFVSNRFLRALRFLLLNLQL